MRLAQQLYEGIDIKGNGTVGLISYLRTDSTRISDEADAAARSYIGEQYGQEYAAVGETGNKNKMAQDAHEAIRPTDVTRTPVLVKESLSRDQFRLYQLIWRRFVASRMKPAVYETTSAKITGNGYLFTAASSRIKFDGFMSVYTQEEDEKTGQDHGRAGNRPSEYLCADNHDDHQPPLCGERKQEPVYDRTGRSGQ